MLLITRIIEPPSEVEQKYNPHMLKVMQRVKADFITANAVRILMSCLDYHKKFDKELIS